MCVSLSNEDILFTVFCSSIYLFSLHFFPFYTALPSKRWLDWHAVCFLRLTRRCCWCRPLLFGSWPWHKNKRQQKLQKQQEQVQKQISRVSFWVCACYWFVRRWCVFDNEHQLPVVSFLTCDESLLHPLQVQIVCYIKVIFLENTFLYSCHYMSSFKYICWNMLKQF